MKRALLQITFCLLAFSNTGYTQVTQPTLTSPRTTITSDYGPRAEGSWFHKGIDYRGAFGDDITCVDSGLISRIDYLGGGWNLLVQGSLGNWEYIHIFTGNNLTPLPISIRDGVWELHNVDLVNPDNLLEIVRSNIIIHRIDGVVQKVLSSINNRLVRFSNGGQYVYLEDSNGNRIRTKNTVNSGEIIAPVGNSGDYPIHLHLEYENGENPLFHVVHPPDVLPTIAIENPPTNHILTSYEKNNNFPFKVSVDSSGGLDVDKVNFWVYPNNDQSNAIHIGENFPTFNYGGKSDEIISATVISSDGLTTGVQPIVNEAGSDRFIYFQSLESLNLSDGEHAFVVQVEDINGNQTPLQTQLFYVDTGVPIVQGSRPNGADVPIETNAISFISVDPLIDGYASGIDSSYIYLYPPIIEPVPNGYWIQEEVANGIEFSYILLDFLQEDTTYTVTIQRFSDLAQNASSYSWSFTTEDKGCEVCEEWNEEQNECVPKTCYKDGCDSLGCNPITDECEFECEDCDDGNLCTKDYFIDDECINEPIVCGSSCLECRSGTCENNCPTGKTCTADGECREDGCDVSQCLISDGEGRCISMCLPKQICDGGICKSDDEDNDNDNECGLCEEKIGNICKECQDDGNPCTDDKCINNSCSHRPKVLDICKLCDPEQGEYDKCPEKPGLVFLSCTGGTYEYGCDYRDKCPESNTDIECLPDSCICTEREYTYEYDEELKECVEGINPKTTSIPGCENPDDNYSFDTPDPDSIISNYSSNAVIGVYHAGWLTGTFSLLEKFGITARIVYADELNEHLATILDLLIIPSGGLSSMAGSSLLKEQLANYIENGGNLFVLSQELSSHWEVLPGNVKGYGWQEDTGCLTQSLGLNIFHQAVSWITQSKPDVAVDGYFTHIPEDAITVFTRTANWQPAYIIYKYGEGTIGATTAYPDWGHQNGQTADDINLFRDFVSWGVFPDTLPQFQPSDTVHFTLPVINESYDTAVSGYIQISTPARDEIIKTIPIETILYPGQEIDFTISFSLPVGPQRGIWHTSYTLFDGNSDVIATKEPYGGRFVVAYPPEPVISKDIGFSVTSNANIYTPHEIATFTMNLFNRSSEAKTIDVYWCLPHSFEDTEDPIYGGPGSEPSKNSSLMKTIVVPAEGSSFITYSVPVIRQDRLKAQLVDEEGLVIGNSYKGFFVEEFQLAGLLTTEQSTYIPEDTVNIMLSLSNDLSATYTGIVALTVTDPQGEHVFQQDIAIILDQDRNYQETIAYQLPAELLLGKYTVTANVASNASSTQPLLALQSLFYVSESGNISIEVVSDKTNYHRGDNAQFTITMTNDTDEPRSYSLSYLLPEHYRQTQDGSYGGATAATSSLTANPTVAPHTSEIITYTVPVVYSDRFIVASDEGSNGVIEHFAGFIVDPVAVSLSATSEQPGYDVGDTAVVHISLENLLDHQEEFTVVAHVVDEYNSNIYEQTLIFTDCAPNIREDNSFSFTVPQQSARNLVVKAFAYNANSDMVGSTISGEFALQAPRLKLSSVLPDPWQTDNILTLTISNIGNSDATGTLTVIMTDPESTEIHHTASAITVSAGSSSTQSIPIIVSPIRFGNYELFYEFSSSVQTVSKYHTIRSEVSFTASLDRTSSYFKVNEMITPTITISNYGDFLYEQVPLSMTMPELEYDYTTVVDELHPWLNKYITPPAIQAPLMNTENSWSTGSSPYFTPLSLESILDVSTIEQLESVDDTSIVSPSMRLTGSLDKENVIYHTRENGNATLVVSMDAGSYTNPADTFIDDIQATVHFSFPDMGIDATTDITITPDMVDFSTVPPIEYPFTIAPDLPYGNYCWEATLSADALQDWWGLYYWYESGCLKLNPAMYALSIPNTTYLATDDIIVSAQNTGGVDGSFYYFYSLSDMNDNAMLSGSGTGAAEQGAIVDLEPIPLDASLSSDYYRLMVVLINDDTYQTFTETWIVSIAGQQATLAVYTDKETYIESDDITSLANIVSGNIPISDGELALQITRNTYRAETSEWLTYKGNEERTGNANGIGDLVSARIDWSVGMGYFAYYISPAIADLDGNGSAEVITVANASELQILDGKTGIMMWNYYLEDNVIAQPTIADVTGDGIYEIIINSEHALTVFDIQTQDILWEISHGMVWCEFDCPAPTALDFDNDGEQEILLVMAYDESSYPGLFSFNGATGDIELSDEDLGMIVNHQMSPAFGDIDDDGLIEAVLTEQASGEDYGALFAVDYQGDFTFYEWDFVPERTPVIADLEGDGIDEIIMVGTDDTTIQVVVLNGYDGSVKWHSSNTAGLVFDDNYEFTPVSVGDLDNDGEPEIAIAEYEYVYVLDAYGAMKWEYEEPYGSYFKAPLLIADVNGDSNKDVVAISIGGWTIHGINGPDGNQLWEVEEISGYTMPVAGDIDGDGYLEILAAEQYGTLYALGAPDILWKEHNADNGFTASYIDTLTINKNTNEIWLASDSPSLWHYDGTSLWHEYTTADGLPSDIYYFYDIAVDEVSGDIWMAGYGGLVHYNGSVFTHYTPDNSSLPTDRLLSVAVDNNGVVWIGTYQEGIMSFDGALWESYYLPQIGSCYQPHTNQINDIAITPDTNNIWIATNCGAAVFNNSDWTVYATYNSDMVNNYLENGLVIDNDGDVWFATSYSGVMRFDGSNFITYTTVDGLASDEIQTIAFDPHNNSIWLSHYGGFSYYQSGHWYTTSSPLGNTTYLDSMAITPQGYKWIYGNYKLLEELAEKPPKPEQESDGGELVEEVVWETTLTIDVPAAQTLHREELTGNLGLTGQFVLTGTLTSSIGQVLSENSYPFTIREHDVDVKLLTDKTIYKPSEVITVSVVVANHADVLAEDMSLQVTHDNALLETQTFNLADGTTLTFTMTAAALAQGLHAIEATLLSNDNAVATALTSYRSLSPQVDMVVSAPPYVDDQPFTIDVTLENTSLVPAAFTVNLTTSDDVLTTPVTLSAGQEETMSFTQQLTEGEATYNVWLEGDISAHEGVTVIFGAWCNAEVYAFDTYPEGLVSVEYYMENMGELSFEHALDMTLYDASSFIIAQQRIGHFLEPYWIDESLSWADGDVELGSLSEGTYRLVYTTYYGPSGSLPINVFKPKASATVLADSSYPEGQVTIPLTITNMQPIPVDVSASIVLYRDAVVIDTQQIFINLQEGASFDKNLSYGLTSGQYHVVITGDNLVSAAEAVFEVKKSYDITISSIIPDGSCGNRVVAVDIANQGLQSFAGDMVITTAFSSQTQSVSVPAGNTISLETTLSLAHADIGNHDVLVEVSDSSGNTIYENNHTITVTQPKVEITSLPAYELFIAGQTGSLPFTIENSGDKTALVQFILDVFDGEGMQTTKSIAPCEAQTIPASFMIPEDIEANDYPAYYHLAAIDGVVQGQSDGIVMFGVDGAKVNVTAELDKELYSIGDTAQLRLTIENIGSQVDVDMVAQVRYNEHHANTDFLLTTEDTILDFAIPITTFTPSKLLYEIRFPSGRAIYINTLILHEQTDGIWLTTDKALYLPGEDVHMTAEANTDGIAYVAIDSFDCSTELELTAHTPIEISCQVPLLTYGGTKTITYGMAGHDHAYRFNVDSYRALFSAVSLNKTTYTPQEEMDIAIVIEADREFTAYLKGSLILPDESRIEVVNEPVNLMVPYTELSKRVLVDSAFAGVHKLYLELFLDEDQQMALSTDLTLFDVGSLEISAIRADKSDYESHVDGASLFVDIISLEDNTGLLSLYFDGTSLASRTVTIGGNTSESFYLKDEDIAAVGWHTVKAVLVVDGLTSEKESTIATVDTINPEITINNVEEGMWYNVPVYPQVLIDDENLTLQRITINGNDFENGDAVTEEGSQSLFVQAQDEGGNYVSQSMQFGIDMTPPQIIIAGVSDGRYYAAPVTPLVTVYDDNLDGSSLLLNGQPFISGTEISDEGEYALTVSAWDVAGNVTETVAVLWTIDVTAPEITITGVEDGSYLNESVTPIITVTDENLGPVTILLDGHAFESGTTVASEGTHTLLVVASDVAGNRSDNHVITWVIDTTPPVIMVSGVIDGTFYNSDVTPIITVNDGYIDQIETLLNGQPYTSGTVVSAEGDYALEATATDLAGNQATPVIITWTIDTTPPNIIISGVTDGNVYNSDVTPIVTAENDTIASSAMLLNGVTFTSGTTVTSEGSYVLQVTMSDLAGNTATAEISWTIDTTAPHISITGVSDGMYYNTDVTPVIIISESNDSDEKLIQLNGAAFISGSVVSDEGSYSLYVYVTDAAGNAASQTVAWVIDTTAPVITIAGVSDGAYYNTSVTPTISVSDENGDMLTALLNDASFLSGTTVTDEGFYVLYATATDKAGNSAVPVSVSWEIDTTMPVITISGVVDGQLYNADVSPLVSVTDNNIDTIISLLNGAPYTSGTVIVADGDYQLSVTATDLAGNTVGPETRSWIIDQTPPWWPSGSALIAVNVEANDVDLTWSAAEDNRAVTSYLLYQDGSAVASVDVSALEHSLSGLSPDTLYSFAVAAGDEAGNWSSNNLELDVTTASSGDSNCPDGNEPDMCGDCLEVELLATRSYHPSQGHDDAHCLCRPIDFIIPAEIEVTNPYDTCWVDFEYQDPTTNELITCLYKNNNSICDSDQHHDNQCSHDYHHNHDNDVSCCTHGSHGTNTEHNDCHNYENNQKQHYYASKTYSGKQAYSSIDILGNASKNNSSYKHSNNHNVQNANTNHCNDSQQNHEPGYQSEGIFTLYECTNNAQAGDILQGDWFKLAIPEEESTEHVQRNRSHHVNNTDNQGDRQQNEPTEAFFIIRENDPLCWLQVTPTFNFALCAFHNLAIYNNAYIASYNPQSMLPGTLGHVASHGDVKIINNAHIYGSALVGGNISMKNNAVITGDVYLAGSSYIKNAAEITGDIIAIDSGITPCDCGYQLEEVFNYIADNNNNDILYANHGIARYMKYGGLSISDNKSVLLPAGDYYLEYLTIKNNASLLIEPQTMVRLFIKGTIEMKNNADISVPVANNAELYMISKMQSNHRNSIHLQNNSDSLFYLYAPMADIELKNNSSLYGGIVGRTLTVKNNGRLYLNNTEIIVPSLVCE